MPQLSHSIALAQTSLPTDQAVAKIWAVLQDLGVKPGGSYALQRYSDDGKTAPMVAAPQGLPRDDLPTIKEPASSYNHLSYWLLIDTHELAITVDTRSPATWYGVLFFADALEIPGAHWLARACEALVQALGIEAAVLLESGPDERAVEADRKAGRPLLEATLNALRGQSGAKQPLLAVLDANAVPPDLYDIARDAGIRVGAMPTGAIMFSTIHE